MKKTSIVLLACAAAALQAARADTVDARCDVYPKGSDRASAVLACKFSQRQGHVSIDRSDGVRHELSPRGSGGNYVDQDGRPAYRNRGLGSRGLIFRLATESVYVYWDTAGLPGTAGASRASAAPAAAPAQSAVVPAGRLDRTLEWQGIRFRVVCANDSSINRLEITPTGLEVDNQPIVREIDGTVSGIEVADLDANGSPELYIYVTSAGSGSYGSVVAYAVNRRMSLSEAYMAPITDHPTASKGYLGHDQFAVGEGRLLRRFPVYRSGDPNSAPSGGTRQIQYRLEPGEATWQLRIDRIVEY